MSTSAWVLAYLGIGDTKEALRWLISAADNKEPENGWIDLQRIKLNSYSDPVLDEPDFLEVRRRLGFRE